VNFDSMDMEIRYAYLYMEIRAKGS
jgi:hypothetical protein